MGITHLCFGFSYLAVFGLETAQTAWPRKGLRLAAILFAAAGLLAHTLFLLEKQPMLAMPYGSLLLLAWVLILFYFYGTLHRGSRAWAVFFLPIVLFLVWLAYFAFRDEDIRSTWFSGEHFWGMFHGGLLLGAAVCITLGAVASVMYLIQSNRLRRKRNPLSGMKLLSLESLERINRRSIYVSFPLLTVGLLLGFIRTSGNPEIPWSGVKIFGTVGLCLSAALLMFARYKGSGISARKLAWLTIAVFGLLLVTLFAHHPAVGLEGAR